MLELTVIYQKQADEQTRQFLKKSISTSYSFREARLFVMRSREEGLGRMVR
jgi:hypothetical protein